MHGQASYPSSGVAAAATLAAAARAAASLAAFARRCLRRESGFRNFLHPQVHRSLYTPVMSNRAHSGTFEGGACWRIRPDGASLGTTKNVMSKWFHWAQQKTSFPNNGFLGCRLRSFRAFTPAGLDVHLPTQENMSAASSQSSTQPAAVPRSESVCDRRGEREPRNTAAAQSPAQAAAPHALRPQELLAMFKEMPEDVLKSFAEIFTSGGGKHAGGLFSVFFLFSQVFFFLDAGAQAFV